MPTEAEWEHACRVGTETVWCFGDDENLLNEYAWYEKNPDGKTHPVGEKKANASGLHDMHGNVWEWCADAYCYDFYEKSSEQNPVATASAEDYVFRGGSWLHGMRDCRSSARNGLEPDFSSNDLGFRCVRVLGKAGW